MTGRLLRALVLVLGLPAVAWGQVRIAGSAPDSPIKVECVSGCVAGGGATDVDDNSVAGGQTVGLQIALPYGFDGAVWRRTSLFGLAGANAQAVAIVDGTGTQVTSFGGGTQYATGAAVATPTGTVALGHDGANVRALKTDATGQLAVTGTFWQATQPVSGTFWQATQPVSGTVAVSNSFLLDATFTARINTLGQKTMANSTPVVLASDQAAIPVTGTFFQATQPVSGTVAATQGTTPWVVNKTQTASTNLATPAATAPANTEVAEFVRPVITQRSVSANLTAACAAANINSCGANSTVEIVLDTYNGVSAQIVNTGYAVTLVLDWSLDGSTWVAGTIYIGTTVGTATVPPSGKDLQVVLATGTTGVLIHPTIPVGVKKARIRLQVLTTVGTTLTPTLVANTNGDPFAIGALNVQANGRSSAGAFTAKMGGEDGTTNCTIVGVGVPCLQAIQVTSKAANGNTTPLFLNTQDAKDVGRQSVMVTLTVASTQVAELLVTITKSVGLAATTTCSSCTITSGKRFRIQSIAASARNSTGTVAGNVTIRLRAAVAGATSAASPLQLNMTVELQASAASTLFPSVTIPDGFEIDSNAGTNTWGLTITDPHWVTAAQVTTFDLTLVGYEY